MVGGKWDDANDTRQKGLASIMDWFQRCYADDRTERQVLMGVPHYCIRPRVPAYLPQSPRAAPLATSNSSTRNVWDPMFANSELNSYGIPKTYGRLSKFSCGSHISRLQIMAQQPPQRKRRLHRSMTEKTAGEHESEVSALGGSGGDIHSTRPRQQKL